MKNKKILLAVLCVILLAAVVGVLCIGMRVAPTVNHALRISELMQPVLNAQNQMMHIAVSAEIDGKALGVESDIFRITEEDTDFIALEQGGNAVFVSGKVLYLENGKAFKIGDDMQMTSYQDLLPQIGVLFDVLKITVEETDSQTAYSVTVTGEQVNTLLEAASLGETLTVEGIHGLQLQLTEKNGKLDHIAFSGSGNADGSAVQLHVTISGFRILASGDYPIPEAVQQSAAAVNPEELFSLTEDLYRLVLALAPFADMESIDGTLDLTVDYGLIQLDTKMRLSDLQTASNGQIDPEKLQALPEVLGWLCMEGEIACTPKGNAYVYTLILDQASMKELSRMILPELAQYSENLMEGSVFIILDAGKIISMNVSIEGKISALITQIPIAVGADFNFD